MRRVLVGLFGLVLAFVLAACSDSGDVATKGVAQLVKNDFHCNSDVVWAVYMKYLDHLVKAEPGSERYNQFLKKLKCITEFKEVKAEGNRKWCRLVNTFPEREEEALVIMLTKKPDGKVVGVVDAQWTMRNRQEEIGVRWDEWEPPKFSFP